MSTLNEFLSKTKRMSAKQKILKMVYFIIIEKYKSFKKKFNTKKRENETLKIDALKSHDEVECNSIKYKEENFLEFLENDIDKSKQASMIYGVRRNNKHSSFFSS